ncbi:hypothetical protein ACA106_20945 [Agrobacterium pusense]|uniref:hypothetical protein n=1 Tax=Agrobacterium pusense TaxID=648995 RepID=UPI0035A6525D
MTEIAKIPPRPKYHDPVVVERAVEEILVPVQQWVDLRAQFQPKDLKAQLTDCIHNNGYEYAKELEERYGWEPNAALVSCLDKMDIHEAHRQVVWAWVISNGVKVPFQIGNRVVCIPTLRAGTVKDIDRGAAQLSVLTDEDRDSGNDYRHLINFEDAIPILGTIGEAALVEGGAV